jgi:hypothetical protein
MLCVSHVITIVWQIIQFNFLKIINFFYFQWHTFFLLMASFLRCRRGLATPIIADTINLTERR